MADTEELVERLKQESASVVEFYGPEHEHVALFDQAAKLLEERTRELEEVVKPISWQDVRLAAGEGKLRPEDVLAACNAELSRRASHSSRARERKG